MVLTFPENIKLTNIDTANMKKIWKALKSRPERIKRDSGEPDSMNNTNNVEEAK